jgi:hypothetical protein
LITLSLLEAVAAVEVPMMMEAAEAALVVLDLALDSPSLQVVTPSQLELVVQDLVQLTPEVSMVVIPVLLV